ncbi:hypothetical protein [Peribacillus frigoritolerans]
MALIIAALALKPIYSLEKCLLLLLVTTIVTPPMMKWFFIQANNLHEQK